MRSEKDLMPHQVTGIHRMVESPEQAALLKMGLGKTAIELFAILERKVHRTLVVAPAQVVERDVWGREAREWRELRHLHVVPIVGPPKRRQALLASASPGPRLDVISYDNVVWLCEELGHLESTYAAIIFDELSKVKHPGTRRFRKLRAFAEKVPVRSGLTGSPVGNHLLDLWGEMFMVAGKKPFGPSFVQWKLDYFRNTSHNPRFEVWEPMPGSMERAIEAIRPYAFSFSEELAADVLPEVRVAPIDLELPAKVREIECELAAQCRAELDSGKDLIAVSASARAAKARQLASGAVYYDPLDETQPWEAVHDVKLKALDEILDEQQGEPIIVFYWFKHERERILQRYKFAREASNEVLDAWDQKRVPLLLLHPQSSGHGLNLQKGGSSVVWYTLPHSHELWEQGNGREARPGQTAPYVTVTPILAGEYDRAVLELLRQKKSIQSAIIAGVELTPSGVPWLEDLLRDPVFS